MPEEKKKKKLSPQQGIAKARMSCAYQERCQQEMRDKLYEWGLFPDAVENIIADLISNNYLNEERFAISFAGGKFRIKKWGRIKIKIELKKRKISGYCINKAMQEIDDKDYLKTLSELLNKKSKETKGGNERIRNYKIAQYAISRGFEPEIVWDVLNNKSDQLYF